MTDTVDSVDTIAAGIDGTAAEPCPQRPDRLRAAVTAAQRIHARPVTLPLVGAVHMPATDEVGFAVGIGALAVVGALEWPVAVVLCTGRLLAHVHRSRALAAFGDALEHA